MCRWLIFKSQKGASAVLADVITRPKNSLINQAFHQCYTPGLAPGQSQTYDAKQHHQRNAALNGDGFGVAWYSDVHRQPAVFRSVTPAWNNENLFEIARVIRSSCILAHVRAASTGLGVSEANCHPFRYGVFTFMHNGCIAGFSRIKRHIQSILRDDVYSMIKGSTDSEHMFALIMNFLADPRGRYTAHQLAQAMEMAIAKLLSIQRQHGISDPSSMNFALCDGVSFIATRARNDPCDPHSEPPSLYYKVGTNFRLNRDGGQGVARMDGSEDKEFDTIICSSEPLNYDDSWRLVPKDTMLVSTSVEGEPLKYWLKPLDFYNLDSARVKDAWSVPMTPLPADEPEPHPAPSRAPGSEQSESTQSQPQPQPQPQPQLQSQSHAQQGTSAANFVRPLPLPRPAPIHTNSIASEAGRAQDEGPLYPAGGVFDESAYQSPRLDLASPRSPQQPMCSFEFATRRGESESESHDTPEPSNGAFSSTSSSSDMLATMAASKAKMKIVTSPECKQAAVEFEPATVVKVSPRARLVASQLLSAATCSPLSSPSPSESPSPASSSSLYASASVGTGVRHDAGASSSAGASHHDADLIRGLSRRVEQLEQELANLRRAQIHH